MGIHSYVLNLPKYRKVYKVYEILKDHNKLLEIHKKTSVWADGQGRKKSLCAT